MSRKATLLAVGALLVWPASAAASGPHLPVVTAGVLGTLGGVFGSIGHAVLGAFSWTISLASKFILTTIAALVKLLIPHAWVNKGLQIMEWIVAVPNYAGHITTPGGGHEYGFAGINALRDLFMWLGVAAAPLTLVYATTRAMIGESEPVGLPLVRMVVIAVAVASYPYWWAQAAALTDQVTHAILTVPEVSRGLYKLMQYAVGGVALGGWQLVDLGLMGAIGIELLALIFLKVAVILLGAVLYATGPLMIGLVPTRAGGALARAWLSAVMMLFALGIAWATVFAVGALLVGDSSTAGPLIGGNSTFGSLMGGMLLAVAGLASLWLCLKAAKEAAGLLRLQVAGLLTLTQRRHAGPATSTAGMRTRASGQSLREYGSRLARATAAAGGSFAEAIPAGQSLVTAGRAVGYVGRRGLIGTATANARAGLARAAGPTGALVGRSRAGALAVRMARAGTASWTTPPSTDGRVPRARASGGSRAPTGRSDRASQRVDSRRVSLAVKTRMPADAATHPVSFRRATETPKPSMPSIGSRVSSRSGPSSPPTSPSRQGTSPSTRRSSRLSSTRSPLAPTNRTRRAPVPSRPAGPMPSSSGQGKRSTRRARWSRPKGGQR